MKKIIIVTVIVVVGLLPFFIVGNKNVFVKIEEGSTPKQVAKVLKKGLKE